MTGPRRPAILALAVVGGWLATAAFGFGSGGGDDWCGACGLPISQEADGNALRQSFAAIDSAALMQQRHFETLCENHPCGALTEVQARDWLDDLIAYDERRWAWWLGFGGLLAGGLGLLVSVLSLLWTIRTDRHATAANDRSIRTEAQVDMILHTAKPAP